MGAFRDFWLGPQSSNSAPEARAVVEPVLPQPNVNEALIIPRRDRASDLVAENEALGMIAVYRAVNLIATAGIQLSFDSYRVKDDSKVTPKPLILRRLDADEPFHVSLEKLYNSLALNGNFFARVFRDAQGRVQGARVLNPHDVLIDVDPDGNVTGYQYKGRTYAKGEIVHRSLARVPGDPRGRGPIQAAQAELRGALDTRDYASHWFTDSGVPTGVLSAKQTLTPEMAAAYKKQWTDSQGGTRGVAVLGNDTSYQPVYLSPEDAQFIQGQQFNTTAIARLFGIPAGLMLAAVEGTSMTYTNQQQAWVEFQRFTLARYVIEVESFFTELLPRTEEAKANYEALLAPDTSTRYAAHAIALTNSWLSVNEVRAIEGLEPAPDGDFKTAQQKVAEAQAFAAPAPEADEEKEAPSESA